MEFQFDFKYHRAAVIQRYLADIGRSRVVVCTCGNAARKLRKCKLDVLEVGPQGQLSANSWLKPEFLAQTFPDRFDATSGHLPLFLMLRIASMMRAKCPDGVEIEAANGVIHVPSGSGESAVITAMAFPGARVVAVFNSSKHDTLYEVGNVLYRMFPALGITIEHEN